MPGETFHERLRAAWRHQQSLLCVGIDPELSRLPVELQEHAQPFLAFGKAIVDATAPHVCAFKPQAAHFAAKGFEDQLAALIEYIHHQYPGIPVILDAKRGDIGGTAICYAQEAFERYAADAVTVNPYLGYDSIAPYLAYQNRGVIVLCRTSNPHSDWLQKGRVEETPLYLAVARQVAEWDEHQQCMLVTGATYPEELRRVRDAVEDMPLLVPGVGAQGGDIERVISAGKDQEGAGMVISSSRGIIFASSDSDFAQRAADAAQRTKAEINKARGVITG